ncbi:hypothetical protein Rcae01_04568 [Novipirellula caenicola]|uniref:Uncharacterized protein n=1 Tax=Novipirellula caenicola TaxID=1536901 RepID=A0ABP9VVB6_9BACT
MDTKKKPRHTSYLLPACPFEATLAGSGKGSYFSIGSTAGLVSVNSSGRSVVSHSGC